MQSVQLPNVDSFAYKKGDQQWMARKEI